LELAVEIAGFPEGVRGFGHVKEQKLSAALRARDALLSRWTERKLESPGVESANAPQA
jgi:hypothetical protein